MYLTLIFLPLIGSILLNFTNKKTLKDSYLITTILTIILLFEVLLTIIKIDKNLDVYFIEIIYFINILIFISISKIFFNFSYLPSLPNRFIYKLKKSSSKAIISFSIIGWGGTSITILDYGNIISYIRSIISNISIPNITIPYPKNYISIPNIYHYTPKLIKSQNSLNEFTSEQFTTYYNAKWAIASHNINSSLIDNLWHLFHNNLHMFIPIAGIILYSIFPNLYNIYKSNKNSANNIINLLYTSNLFRLSNSITVYINTRLSNQISNNFQTRFVGSNIANRARNAANITRNRTSIIRNLTRLEEQSSQFTALLRQLYNIGINYRQDSDGTSTISINYSMLPYISFQQMLELNPILYNQIININTELEIYLQSISGLIYDISRSLGQNSSIFENAFPNEANIDQQDLLPDIVNYINSVNMYDIETFYEVYNESKIEYTNQNFN